MLTDDPVMGVLEGNPVIVFEAGTEPVDTIRLDDDPGLLVLGI